MSKPYRKIFIQNPSFRLERGPLEALCEELVTVCDTPMFDEHSGTTPDELARFEGKIAQRMCDFDPTKDAIGVYGDPAILAMQIIYVLVVCDEIRLLRYSAKRGEYIEREIGERLFDAAHV